MARSASDMWCMGPRFGGRLDRAGGVVEPLDEASVLRAVRRLLSDGIESLAICLLHSYANPGHERRVREIAEGLAPELSISCRPRCCPKSASTNGRAQP